MKLTNSALAGFLTLVIATIPAYAAIKVLPDSCGDPAVTFQATTVKPTAVPAPPAEGKAQLVLIQVSSKKGMGGLFGIHDWTTRFGLDGRWIGAAGNNSYFAVDIEPGEHHLCGNVQNSMSGAKDMIGMQKFTAEAGKVYFFQFSTLKVSTSGQNSSDNYYSFHFDPVDEDEGKFRVKSLQVSTSTAVAPEPEAK